MSFKTLFVVAIIFIPFVKSGAQTHYGGSPTELQQKLKNSLPDTNRVQLLLSLSKTILLKSGAGKLDIDSSYSFMKQAEQLSLKLKDIKSQANTKLIEALICNKKGDKNKGLALSQKAMELFKNIDDLSGMGEAAVIIGQHYGIDGDEMNQRMIYYKKGIDFFHKGALVEREATTLVDYAELQAIQGQYKESIDSCDRALLLYKSIKYKPLQRLYDLIGTNYAYLGISTQALKYQLAAIQVSKANNDTTSQMSTIYNRTGLTYYLLQNNLKAIEYFEMGLSYAKKYKDSASIYMLSQNIATIYNKLNQPLKALPILAEITGMNAYHTTTQQIDVNYAFVNSYLALKQYKKVKYYLDRLDKLYKDAGPQSSQIVRAHINYNLATGQYEECYPYLKKNQELLKKDQILQFLAYNHLWWFKADSATRRYRSAIDHYQLYKMYSDSANSVNKHKQTSQLQFEFDRDKKVLQQANSIQRLQTKSLLEIQKTKSNTRLFIVSVFVLLLLLALGYNRYYFKQRHNLKLQAQQNKINMQKSALEDLIEDKDRLLVEKDDLIIEKDWLLKEIHHRVKNNLQIVMSLLNTQSAYLKNTAAITAIRESQNRVQAISLIHQKLYNVNNEASIEMGGYITDLVNYLKDCFDTNKRSIRFDIHVERIRIDIAEAVPLGLILNEAVTNSIKYAFDDRPGIINISFEKCSEDIIRFNIMDNGKGLPKDFELVEFTSLGMEMIKALSKQLGAHLKIKNVNGACITFEFKTRKYVEKFNPVNTQSAT